MIIMSDFKAINKWYKSNYSLIFLNTKKITPPTISPAKHPKNINGTLVVSSFYVKTFPLLEI